MSDDDPIASKKLGDGAEPSDAFDSFLRDVARSEAIDPPTKDGLVGSLLLHYRVVAEIGRGGMGVVYLARDSRLGRDLALKVLPASLAGSDARRRRFLREARAAAAINHPTIATIYDVGEAGGRLFLAMELVEGVTLRARLAEGPLAAPEGLRLARQMAQGLARAHEKRIVHRDLKPENVMITRDGDVRILDFGLAKLREPESEDDAPPSGPSTLTRDGCVVGTPGYMSPEQATGRVVDQRTDIYAFGVVLHEMLAGELPGALGSGKGVLHPGLGAIVTRCLARAPEDRWKDGGDLLGALDAAEEPRANGAWRSLGAFRAGSPRRSTALIAVGAVAVVAAAAVTYSAFFLPQVSYCGWLEESEDGPRCSISVTQEDVRVRGATARVTKVGGRVVRIDVITFSGDPLGSREVMFGEEPSAVGVEIVRAKGGAVQEVVYRGRLDQIVRWEKWSDGGALVNLVDLDGTTPRHDGDTRITSYRQGFDGDGAVTRERYFGPTGRERPANGAYGQLDSSEDHRHRLHSTSLAADGEPGATSDGVSRRDALVSAAAFDNFYFDLDGRPFALFGVWHQRYRLNRAFEIAGWVSFGAHEERVYSLRAGYQEQVIDEDWRSRTRTFSFRGADEKPSLYTHGFNSGARWYWDDHGRIVRGDLLDGNGDPIAVAGLFASDFLTWQGLQIVGHRTVDARGAPMVDLSVGAARQAFVNNERGAKIETRNFDEEDRPASALGGAVQRVTRDDRDLETATENFSADGQRVVDPAGAWSHATKYDRLRNVVERAALGVDGRPTLTADGTSIDRFTYDENDDLVAESHYDPAGQLLMLKGEYATKRLAYDHRGLVVEEQYLDFHGEPAFRKAGWATVKYTRDREGDVTDESYLGKHGEPIVRAGGYAKKRNAYDIHRRRIVSSLYDVAGAPALGTDGWSVEKETYDARGLLAREDHFDAAGAPVLAKDGSASRVNVWDERGNVTETMTLGTDGNPIATPEGYATKKSVYNEGDSLAEESLFGADAKPIAGAAGWSIRKLRYDPLGNLIEEAWFGVGHEPVAPKGSSFASVRSQYDARQRLTATSWFDASGAPVAGPDGVAAVRYEHDPYGRVIRATYLDGSGTPAPSKDGRVVVSSAYDGAGRLVEERFLDGVGDPRLAADRCAARRTKYDPVGRKVEESCLDAADAPTLSGEGWAIRRTLHDARGNDVDVSTFAPDGALHPDENGVARRVSRFDERNLRLETAYVDAAGKPAHDRRGVHVIRFTYDERGVPQTENAFDERERPLKTAPARSAPR